MRGQPLEMDGLRVGILTVGARITEEGARSKRTCRCDCGATVNRTEHALRQAKLTGKRSSCDVCRRRWVQRPPSPRRGS